jgi:hypothetical protein
MLYHPSVYKKARCDKGDMCAVRDNAFLFFTYIDFVKKYIKILISF